jgi:hypothetical protein
MTYEEFRKDWYEKCINQAAKDDLNGMFSMDLPNLLEMFCRNDYKRHTGEWKETL